MSPSKRPRKPKKSPRYDGAVPQQPNQPDPGPLPAPPFAVCPRCGRVVAVCVSLGYELFAHRTPMPESRLCDYPTRVKKSDVVFPASGLP
jgi:hypothetical protein